LIDRARAVAAHAAVVERRDPASAPPLQHEPADLSALYAVADGIDLADGTRILRRAEVLEATAWLVADKALEWGPDLWVIGERDDLVVVRDLDGVGTRAGGGVLEAPTDGLSRLSREALDVIGYLEDRLGIGAATTFLVDQPSPGAVRSRAPERAAREAVARRDARAIAEAIARPFYPGAERELAHAALTLGAVHAGAGDVDRALGAFARAVEARVRAAPRGAEASEARAGWRAAAIAAEKAGSPAAAEACRARAAR
jgi:hypothetical protein